MNCRCYANIFFSVNLFVFINNLSGQTSFSAQPAALKNIQAYFFNELGADAHLYTGKEYTGYLRGVKGDPYFISDRMQNGDIFYDGSLYQDIPLLYDILHQQIVINRYNQNFKIALLSEKVKYFTLAGHRFENLTTAGADGTTLYDAVFKGKASLYVKREKYIKKSVRAEDSSQVVQEDKFFIQNENFYEVNNKSSLLQALNNKKDLMKTYMRKNKINFKKNIEKNLITTLAYYSTLNN